MIENKKVVSIEKARKKRNNLAICLLDYLSDSLESDYGIANNPIYNLEKNNYCIFIEDDNQEDQEIQYFFYTQKQLIEIETDILASEISLIINGK